MLVTEEYSSLKDYTDFVCAEMFERFPSNKFVLLRWGLPCDCYAFGVIFACLILAISSTPMSQHDLVHFKIDSKVDKYYFHLGCLEISYSS